jgi:hypothetical protein
MKVYKLGSDSSDEWVAFFAADNLHLPQPQETAAFFARHEVIRLVRNNEHARNPSRQKPADFCNVNYEPFPCFSGNAKKIFEPHLQGLGQWLKMDYEGVPYWLFNITNVVDALDVNRSTFSYFRDGSIMQVEEFVFKHASLLNQWIFYIPQRSSFSGYVTDSFVDCVRKHQLTGFMFQLLWSSETGPTPYGLKDWEKPRITGREPQLAR